MFTKNCCLSNDGVGRKGYYNEEKLIMFIPKKSISVPPNTIKPPHLLLQGPPASGKSYNVLMTFPHIIYVDFENLLPPEIPTLRPPDYIIPFYDREWLLKNSADFGGIKSPMLAYKWWLQHEAARMTDEQTLVNDSLSSIQDMFHIQVEPQAEGAENKYYLWNEKAKYMRDIHLLLRNLKCNVVMIAHEMEPRDEDTGKLTGKFMPYVTGGFKAQIGRNYDNVFRAFTTEGPDKKPVYMWQIKPDKEYNLRTTIKTDAKYVPASFESFKIGQTGGTVNAPS